MDVFRMDMYVIYSISIPEAYFLIHKRENVRRLTSNKRFEVIHFYRSLCLNGRASIAVQILPTVNAGNYDEKYPPEIAENG